MMPREKIRKLLLSITGFDIGCYNPDQMNRLLSTIMMRTGVKTLEDYVRFLRQDPRNVREFKHFITINVSEFFRDKNSFEVLRTAILPGLFRQPAVIHVWSAGCAHGEEAYSMAILFEENKCLLPRYRIWATDIDEEALEKAEQGIYQGGSLKNIPRPWTEKYFEGVGKNYRIDSKLKSKIKFERHDLLTPVEPEQFDLVLCRNVVIYFAAAYKTKLYENVIRALRPGGVLFIGSTETLLNYRKFGLEKIEMYFYRKPFLQR